MKSAVAYSRVSTAQQDMTMQIELAWRKAKELGLVEDQVIVLEDDGVSARKISIHSRRGLNQLIRLISAGDVKILIVYDRDRLARNVMEHMEIFDLLVKHDVKVEFTARNVIPFSHNKGLEAQLALQAQLEGERIAQRTKDARKYYPNSVYGFNRIGKGSDVHYDPKNPEIELLKSIFEEFQLVKTKQSYQTFKSQQRKVLGRDPTSLLINPFFAGVLINEDGTEETLRHVEPLVDISLIKRNIEQFTEWGIDISKSVNEYPESLLRRAEIEMFCYECGQPLIARRYRRNEYYQCSQSCRDVRAEVSEIESAVSDTIYHVVMTINLDDLKTITKAEIASLMKQTSANIQRSRSDLKVLSYQIAQSPLGKSATRYVKRYNIVSHELNEFIEDHAKLKLFRTNIDELVLSIKDALQRGVKKELITLADQLIHSIQLSKEAIIVTNYFASFMQEKGMSE
jgi:DNA invertase Pin-like site-specific DNA recombinase